MPTSRKPTPTAAKHLKAASADPQGRLADSISSRVLSTLLNDGHAYRNDRDGYRLTAEDALATTAGPALITLEGRRAVLSGPQLYSLARHVAPDSRLAPNVTWQTANSLAELRLVEYRDATGRPRPTDGDNGRSGPVHYPFRTDLGRQVAELAPA
ncbi:hypothetical protein [Streptomyces sp. RKAG337]|uniref:hypothetical protein n=1 Tax=Streptomyces sp. RKAG337 TaxID=2893404 RepID=UPI002033B01E|nr:hypothetical protein [Streptomyces sp. RKAG337]MCM2430921.1 hypothetical protein [Streptomyces sp. RKAG337]